MMLLNPEALYSDSSFKIFYELQVSWSLKLYNETERKSFLYTLRMVENPHTPT